MNFYSSFKFYQLLLKILRNYSKYADNDEEKKMWEQKWRSFNLPCGTSIHTLVFTKSLGFFSSFLLTSLLWPSAKELFFVLLQSWHVILLWPLDNWSIFPTHNICRKAFCHDIFRFHSFIATSCRHFFVRFCHGQTLTSKERSCTWSFQSKSIMFSLFTKAPANQCDILRCHDFYSLPNYFCSLRNYYLRSCDHKQNLFYRSISENLMFFFFTLNGIKVKLLRYNNVHKLIQI